MNSKYVLPSSGAPVVGDLARMSYTVQKLSKLLTNPLTAAVQKDWGHLFRFKQWLGYS